LIEGSLLLDQDALPRAAVHGILHLLYGCFGADDYRPVSGLIPFENIGIQVHTPLAPIAVHKVQFHMLGICSVAHKSTIITDID
jgi:hypothetical protein